MRKTMKLALTMGRPTILGLETRTSSYDGDGFEPTDYDDQQLEAWQAQAYVRQLNEQRGVTEQAEACMFVGGLHGWDSPEFTDLADVGDGAFV